MLSLIFGYRFIDFYSGFSPGQAMYMKQVCGGKQVKVFCSGHRIHSISKRHLSLVIQPSKNSFDDIFKFCLHPTNQSSPSIGLMVDFKEQIEVK